MAINGIWEVLVGLGLTCGFLDLQRLRTSSENGPVTGSAAHALRPDKTPQHDSHQANITQLKTLKR